MQGILRIFYKDLFEFLHSPRTIILILVLPVTLIIIIGGINIQNKQVKLLILHQSNAKKEELDKLRDMIGEFSNLMFTFREKVEVDPFVFLNKEHFDLVMIKKENNNIFYTAETDQDRLNRLSEMVDKIGQAIEEDNPLRLLKGSMNSYEFMPYYPTLSPRDMFAVPRVIAIFVCFLPFVLTSITIIRERDEKTLGLLIVSMSIHLYKLYVGKMLLPLFVGIFNLLIMILFAKTWLGLNVKSGFWDIILIHTLAISSSLFFGLIISCLVNSQLQALLSSAIYLICSFIFTGFLFPLEQSSIIIKYLSNLFPLTFSLEPMQCWMFKGTSLYYHLKEICFLLGQGLIYFFISILIFWKFRKEI